MQLEKGSMLRRRSGTSDCGSGKLATPCARTQREKATMGAFAGPPVFEELADPPPVGEPLEPAEDGLPLHAPTRARAQMLTMAAAARRRRPMRRPRWHANPGT
jgi:hypothetical protein